MTMNQTNSAWRQCVVNRALSSTKTPIQKSEPARRFRLVSVVAMVWMALTCHSSSLLAEDHVAEIASQFKVSIHQVFLQGVSRRDRMNGYVSVNLTVQNLTNAEMSLSLEDIKAVCADQTSNMSVGRQKSLIDSKPLTLKPGKVKTGWLRFSLTYASPKEPKLLMKFNIQDQVLDVKLNDAIRKTSQCTWKAIGPKNMLGVISLKRPVDGFAVWVLEETFKEVKDAGIKRAIVEFVAVKDTWAVSSNSVSVNSVDAWLQSASKAVPPNPRVQVSNGQTSSVQFDTLYVVQPSTYRPAAYRYAEIRKPDLPSAVAASLRDVFQLIPVDELEVALTNASEGIRRAALETNLDRISDERLQQIFDLAANDVKQQKLLAAELHRSASPLTLQLLEKLARSPNSTVSRAAIGSIIKSAPQAAISTMSKLWEELEGNVAWETDVAKAILKEDDYRFTPILVTYVERRLIELTSGIPLPLGTTQTTSEPQAGRPVGRIQIAIPRGRNAVGVSTVQSSSSRNNTLFQALKFLRNKSNPKFDDFATDYLLKVKDPYIQDELLAYLTETKGTQISQLVKSYITQRLAKPSTSVDDKEQKEQQPKSAQQRASTSRRYSNRLFSTIKQFPRPEYTERLLELAEDRTLSSPSRTLAYAAAFRGATPQQMDSILDGFSDLIRSRQPQLLEELRQQQHPRYYEFAEAYVVAFPKSARDVFRILPRDHSLESSLLLVKLLDQARKTIEKTELAKDIKTTRPTRTVTSSIYSYVSYLDQLNHPEVLSFLNRLEKSPLIELHALAVKTKERRLNASPNYQRMKQAAEHQANDQAEAIYRSILESDPFDASAMTSLASICMRSDRLEEAMELLQQARKTAPDNVVTESFIALTMIRQGNVAEGLKHIQKTEEEVPDLPTPVRTNVLYNTACAYSRAAEQADTNQQRTLYLKNAFVLLNQSVDREAGFADPEHALADPDLTVLHQEADWQLVIDKMKEKASKAETKTDS